MDQELDAATKDLFQRVQSTIGEESIHTAPEELGSAVFRQYAMAVEDPNPIYSDMNAAHNLGLDSIIAPPTLIFDTMQFFRAEIDSDGYPSEFTSASLGTPWRAGNQYEMYADVRPSDIITIRRKVTDVWLKQGDSGHLIFQSIIIKYQNQHGKLLATNNEVLFYRTTDSGGGL